MSFQVEHSRPIKHWSNRIRGAVCNGCRCLEVVSTKGRRSAGERYWCSARHEAVEPFEVECDKRRD